MALSYPVPVSIEGDARLLRHIHLPDYPGGGQSFVCWVSMGQFGKDRLFIRAMEEVDYTQSPDHSDVSIATDTTHIKNFHVLESQVSNYIIFVWDDGRYVYRLVYDVVNDLVELDQERLYRGTVPTLLYDELMKIFYIDEKKMKTRDDVTGDEKNIVEPSALDITDKDLVRLGETTTMRYAGTHFPSSKLPMTFRTDIDTLTLVERFYFTTLVLSYALPRETISWWSFDDADFSSTTILDKVDGNDGVPMNTPNSVLGQVGEARNFHPNERFEFSQNGNLDTMGDQFVAFWFNADTLKNYHGIYSKGFGSAMGAVYVNDQGDIGYYYGQHGSNGSPYASHWTSEGGHVVVGEWHHFVHVRDMHLKKLKWFVDGLLVSEKDMEFDYVVAASRDMYIGSAESYYTDGTIDEMVLGAAALEGDEVWSLYDKGLDELPADIERSGFSINVLYDMSGNGRHLRTHDMGVDKLGLHFQPHSHARITELPVPEAMTIEMWYIPMAKEIETTIFEGPFYLRYRRDGYLTFGFKGADTHELRQIGLHTLNMGEPNYIAISHTFGSGVNSFIAVNGKPVECQWWSDWTPGSWTVPRPTAPTDPGAENPSLGTQPLVFNPQTPDILQALKISSAALTPADVLEYIRGRS